MSVSLLNWFDFKKRDQFIKNEASLFFHLSYKSSICAKSIFFTSCKEKNLHAVLYNLKYIKTIILIKNNTKKIKKKLFIKFVGTWKLNLKLYAKYNVKREIIISLNRKNSILFSGEGVKNKYILFYWIVYYNQLLLK